LEALQKQGIEFIKPTAEVMDKWYAMASEAAKRLIERGRLSSEIVKALEGTLADYRAQRLPTDE
jgi:hypothetical protein